MLAAKTNEPPEPLLKAPLAILLPEPLRNRLRLTNEEEPNARPPIGFPAACNKSETADATSASTLVTLNAVAILLTAVAPCFSPAVISKSWENRFATSWMTELNDDGDEDLDENSSPLIISNSKICANMYAPTVLVHISVIAFVSVLIFSSNSTGTTLLFVVFFDVAKTVSHKLVKWSAINS